MCWIRHFPVTRLAALGILAAPLAATGAGTPSGDTVFGGPDCGVDLCVGNNAAGSYALDGAACDETYAGGVVVGNFPGGDGVLTVGNGARLTTTTTGVTVGRRGTGMARFESGAQVSMSAVSLGVGDMFDPSGAGARGDITVRGATTTLGLAGLLGVGVRNSGSVIVEDGASLTSSSSIWIGGGSGFGTAPGGTGDVTISGSGTTVQVFGTVVGREVDATLLVEGGGRLESGSFSHDCCTAATTATGTDLGGTPSQIAVTGDLALGGTSATLDVAAGAEVHTETLAFPAVLAVVTLTGTGSLLEVTGDAATVMGNPFLVEDTTTRLDVLDGATARFTSPLSELMLSAGFGTSAFVRVEGGSRLEAGLVRVGAGGFDRASLAIDGGTVAVADRVLIDTTDGGLTVTGMGVIDGDLTNDGGVVGVSPGGHPSAGLQVTGDLILFQGSVDLGGADTQLDVVGSFHQAGGTFELFSVHDVAVGGSFVQDGGTLQLGFPDAAIDGTIQVAGPVEIHGMIQVAANFPPLGTRYRLIDSGTSMAFDGMVLATGLAVGQSLVPEVVGDDLELVVSLPEPAGAAGALGALGSLAGLAPRRRRPTP